MGVGRGSNRIERGRERGKGQGRYGNRIGRIRKDIGMGRGGKGMERA